MTETRRPVSFTSGGTPCAAWHYPGTNGACVVMAGGGAVTKEPGTDPFAAPFHAAGFSVLAFDYRRLGESGGTPRQVIRPADQVADWHAAIDFAATLPDVDPDRIGAWGFSLSGGHVLAVAAQSPRLAAAVAQTPNADGPAAAPTAMKYQTKLALLRVGGRVLADALGSLVGRRPVLIPLAGDPGTVAMLTTPDGRQGDQALNPGNRYPDWLQAVAARSVPAIARYRPGREAAKIACPLLVVVCEDDQTVLAEPGAHVAEVAPHGELVRLSGGHYAPFLEEYDAAVGAELAFLRRALLAPAEGEARVSPARRSAS